MIIESERFGEIDLDDSHVIEFPHGFPGLEELHEFVILQMEETKPILWLQSVSDKYISLPVIIPFEILDDYCINVRDEELEPLGIVSQKDLLVMNVVVITEDITKMTANMAAPIIVDTKIGKGKQIVIDAKDLSTSYPIFEDIVVALTGGDDDVSTVKKEG